MQNKEEPIDFVMTWVDDKDPKWQKDYAFWKQKELGKSNEGAQIERFRDWDTLKYWFRGVEKYASWCNKIFFVTCGQRPTWLKTEHPKLVFVNHEDYIPKQYLPVFSSHPIELNLHRIKDLSEKFVYFNDDIFILKALDKADFFINDQPREMSVEFPMYAQNNDSFNHIMINMSRVLNEHFKKRETIRNYWKKWFSLCYGKYLLDNICMSRFGVISGIYMPHFPSALQKSRMTRIWNILKEEFNYTCSHKFRSSEDVNQYLFRYWNIMEGQFAPINYDKIAKYIALSDKNLEGIKNILNKRQFKIVCLNDTVNIYNYLTIKQSIINSFDTIFPNKSSFEI